MSYGIYVGVTPQAVTALEKALLSILATPAGDTVKLAAFDVLKTLAPHNTSINNCSVTMSTDNAQ